MNSIKRQIICGVLMSSVMTLLMPLVQAADGVLDVSVSFTVPTCKLELANTLPVQAEGYQVLLDDVANPQDLLNEHVVSPKSVEFKASCAGAPEHTLDLQVTGATQKEEPQLFLNPVPDIPVGGARGVGVLVNMSLTPCTVTYAPGVCGANANQDKLELGSDGESVSDKPVYINLGLTAGAKDSITLLRTGNVAVPLTFVLRYP